MSMDFPYRIAGKGRTATTEGDAYVRDLIEQVLFTSPGERVNRPTFGSGLLRLVFEPNSEPLASSTQLAVQGALQQWLADYILVEAVRVQSQEATLEVTVQYVVRRTQERRVERFERSL